MAARSGLDGDIERGETVVVARNGRPVAELTAIVKPTLAAGVAAVRAQHRVRLGGVSIRELIIARDHGGSAPIGSP